MIVLNTIEDTKRELKILTKNKTKSIGFVPTMGALHEGHLSLIRQSVDENDITASSIFVNPIQFNNPEDLKKYPRDLETDIALLKNEGCDLVFAPSAEEMYPEAIEETYDFGHLEAVMEGKHRPGHFQGVAIVVKRLFDIIDPDRAYFGEKDYQQLLIIKSLVKQLELPVEIVPCPIVRESDGLAMSSRNKRLSPQGRRLAPKIYQILKHSRELAKKENIPVVCEEVEKELKETKGIELEYFSISNPETLQPVMEIKKGSPAIACIACYIDGIRLIDNIILFS